MVVVSCSCGEVSYPSHNPVRALPVAQRVRLAGSAGEQATVVVDVDPDWHPGGASLEVACVWLVAEVTLEALVAGLDPADAALVRAAWVLPREDALEVAAPEVAASGRTARHAVGA
ncbi:hypothetical protein AB6N23_13895 [Cellulomonas sp. 179-A 9B4 NHS]|uniref:hypothetical protein n=1 Tax=Cellulomonas sp. 179-A 9B4 NHS TaxID=3142379 RepID=UPI0039A1A6B9